MTVKYTEEQTKEMLEIYQANPTRETVEMLADKYEKSMKSVIGKLAKEGVYRKEVYVSKTGEEVVTKPELVEQICARLEIEELPGLEKAPKLTLKKLLEACSRCSGCSSVAGVAGAAGAAGATNAPFGSQCCICCRCSTVS